MNPITETTAPRFPPLEDRPIKNTICLFDVDGTLTPARLVSFFSFIYTTTQPLEGRKEGRVEGSISIDMG